MFTSGSCPAATNRILEGASTPGELKMSGPALTTMEQFHIALDALDDEVADELIRRLNRTSMGLVAIIVVAGCGASGVLMLANIFFKFATFCGMAVGAAAIGVCGILFQRRVNSLTVEAIERSQRRATSAGSTSTAVR